MIPNNAFWNVELIYLPEVVRQQGQLDFSWETVLRGDFGGKPYHVAMDQMRLNPWKQMNFSLIQPLHLNLPLILYPPLLWDHNHYRENMRMAPLLTFGKISDISSLGGRNASTPNNSLTIVNGIRHFS